MKRVFLLGVLWIFSMNIFSQVVNFPGGNGHGSTKRTMAANLLGGDALKYSGGNGRGSILMISSPSLLGGITSVFIFKGGIGHGSAKAGIESTTMGGGSIELKFFGGIGLSSATKRIGFVNLAGVLNDTIQSASDLSFYGGVGIGSTLKNAGETPLSGNQINIVFSGGIGRGSDSKLSLPFQLNGSVFQQLYPGGQGAGSNSKLSLAVLLSGSGYVQSFFGGNGRGNFQVKSNKITLNGILSAGFARIAQSQIYDFKASLQNQNVRFTWKSANSDFLDYFVVEKSRDGIDFSSIGIVSSSANGKSGLYSFHEQKDGRNENFYRLLQVFNDSSFSYSTVLNVSVNEGNEYISLYPNPVQNGLKLQISNPSTAREIIVMDYSGKVVKQIYPEGLSEIDIDVSDFAPGLYWVEVVKENGRNRIRFARQ